MKPCPYCGYANYLNATVCRKCEASFVSTRTTYDASASFWFGPVKARALRNRALSIFVLGLMIKVYWGGYGPWPVLDNPALVSLRSWLEPFLLFGGATLYALGWALRYI